ncbi:hypothetical protein [Paenibacillus oleatilyticus]|uniref:hypothetical protein n=1 Tax=Paenibacillus oleatilyticus TaxID=2594886 RepID=UPI001C1F33BA|nr:hypothetical protein [Paenibacillus oleatilyticus]MBU7314060.1 hypothetical protein [Paenibacillus oleatilyticus]
MTLTEIVSQFESCGYTCEAGPLESNVAFQALKERSQFKGLTVEVKMTDLDVFQKSLEIILHIAQNTTDEKTKEFIATEAVPILRKAVMTKTPTVGY